jgi:alkanesulfonate monooxygenase SsuD/methylene tetrahydromethanopterin reductase-like flavin-dependent oxidoreductase (luciferase family)
MTIEFIGMIHHRHASEIHPPASLVLDRGYIRDFAQAAEAGGFDRLLVGYDSDAPDGFLVAASAASHTDRIGFLVAHRPGFVAPTVAARKFVTLDQITAGRAAIHVISGGDDVDQHRDGDWLNKDERYARTDEYVHILKRIWTEQGTISHAGAYYRFEDASTAVRCVQQPRIPIYFGGASDAAIDAAGNRLRCARPLRAALLRPRRSREPRRRAVRAVRRSCLVGHHAGQSAPHVVLRHDLRAGHTLRRVGLRHSQFADAAVATIRLKLLKLGGTGAHQRAPHTLHHRLGMPEQG